MQDFEKALEKFLKKRDLVLKRMEDDKAEIEKLNSQIAQLQLAKIKALITRNLYKNFQKNLMKAAF